MGLDTSKTDITRSEKTAKQFQNMEVDDIGNVSGRAGYKVIGQRGDVLADSSLFNPTYPYAGVYEYVYTDKETGANINEIIGFGDRVYKLATTTLQVTGPAGATVDMLLNSETQIFEFVCKVAGVTVSGFPIDLGNGLEASDATLYDVITAINALGGSWLATMTPLAIVNGTQANRGKNDWLSFSGFLPSTEIGKTFEIETADGRVSCLLEDISGSTAEFVPVRNLLNGVFDVYNGTVIGPAAGPAAGLPLLDGAKCDTPLIVNYQYWEEIPFMFSYDNYAGTIVSPEGGIQNISAINASNCLYFAAQNMSFDNYYATDEEGPLFRETNLFKYDGNRVMVCGAPVIEGISVSGTDASASLPEGDYKYNIIASVQDYQGNIVESNDLVSFAPGGGGIAEFTSDGTSSPVIALDIGRHYQTSTGQINGDQSKVFTATTESITLTVGTDCSLSTGEDIFVDCYRNGTYDLSDQQMASGVVTSVTGTSITADITVTIAGTYLFHDRNIITSGDFFTVYRSTVDNNDYYKLFETASNSYGFSVATANPTDDIPDSSLGSEWLGPYSAELRRDPPPRCSMLESHQGLIIASGDRQAPNTIYWSSDAGPENFSISDNQLDIYSSEESGISSIVSSNLDTLCVFKEKTLLPIQGDFGLSTISVLETQRGDVGIPSFGGWQRVRQSILFISNKGSRVLQGVGVESFDERPVSFFIGNSLDPDNVTILDAEKYIMQRIVSVHDTEKRRVIFYLPSEDVNEIDGVEYYTPNNNSIALVIDYSHAVWSTFKTPVEQNMAGGAVERGSDIIKISRYCDGTNYNCHTFKELTGELTVPLGDDLKVDSKYIYADNTEGIENIWRPQWNLFGTPSLRKEFNKIKMWCLNALDRVAFTLRLRSYNNFDEDTIETNTTLDFSDTTTKKVLKELKQGSCDSMMLEYYNNTLFENPTITGYELEIVSDYDPTDLRKE